MTYIHAIDASSNEDSSDCHEVSRLFMYWLFIVTIITCLICVTSFIIKTPIVMGNSTYMEIQQQPWFRNPHFDHRRVEPADKDSSGFGHHYIPTDDVFVPPDWTPREQKYLPCLDRLCVCPLFRGKRMDGKCVLKSGKVLGKAVRTELRMLSNEKRLQWEHTLNWLKQNNIYNRISRVHKYSGIHSGPAFTLWHREFLKRVELIVRTFLPDVNMGVPYWDSSLDAYLPDPLDSVIFSESFLGTVDDDGNVVTGPYANWTTMEGKPHIQRKFGSDPSGELLNRARIDWLMNNDDINMILGATMPLTTCPMRHKLDARMLEYSHDYVHFFISGDMGKSYSSSNDVIFIYHHSMIDLIYEGFRQNSQTRTERETVYPKAHPDCFPEWHNKEAKLPMLQPFTNGDVLSNGYTDEMYEFSPRPTCTFSEGDCGSEYLFCATSETNQPICMSKVKMGGNCKGYENTRICYKGRCVDGKCEPKSKEVKKFTENVIQM